MEVPIHGELTIGEVASLREQLLAALPTDGEPISIDLSGVVACDSAGVQLLLATHRLSAERGTSLSLAHVPACVHEAISTYGLTTTLLGTESLS